MTQSPDGRDNESLQVLRLHGWSPGTLPVSCFKEASLSPCRDMVLLVTNSNEVVLLLLRSMGQSLSGSPHVPPPPPLPTSNGQATIPPYSAQSSTSLGNQAATCTAIRTSSHVSPRTVQASSEKICCPETDTLPRSSLLNTQSFPLISDVLFHTWGSNSDGYNVDNHSILFKELLLVVGEKGLFIHVFPNDMLKDEDHRPSTGAYRRQKSDVFNNSRIETGRWMDWGVTNLNEPCDANLQDQLPRTGNQIKKIARGFLTFLVDAQLWQSGDCVELRFTDNNLRAAGGRVVSFGISYESQAFSVLKQFCGYGDGETSKSQALKFGKMFSGPSFDILGMTLLEEDPASVASDAEDPENQRLLILICKVLHSGLEWFSLIEPGKGSREHRSFHCATFAVADGYLLGLQKKGFLHVWTLLDGKMVTCLNVLQHCGLLIDIPQCQSDECNGESDTRQFQTSKKADIVIEQNLSCARSFVQMATYADCSLIAVMDSLGVIYLISLKSHLEGSSNLITPHYHISTWAIAGTNISSHSFMPESGLHQRLAQKISSSCSNGFCSRWNLPVHEVWSKVESFPPLRRVILPIEFRSISSSIYLSRVGITQIVQLQRFKGAVKRLFLSGEILDDRSFSSKSWLRFLEEQLDQKEEAKIISFCSQGCLHFISDNGLYVVLPPLALSSFGKRDGTTQAPWWSVGAISDCYSGDLQCKWLTGKPGQMLQPWQIEVLDQILIYDGIRVADHIAAENGWSLQLVRLRRLQLALTYAQMEDIEKALDDLVPVGAAVIGIPRMFFSALEFMLNKASGDNEFAHASMLLSLTARFVTKLIHHNGMGQWSHKNRKKLRNLSKAGWYSFLSMSNDESKNHKSITTTLHELSQFLEVTRKMQKQLHLRWRPLLGKKEVGDEPFTDQGFSANNAAGKASVQEEVDKVNQVYGSLKDLMWLVKSGNEGRNHESSGEMFVRWEKEKVNLADIVREALKMGRLPLAVVQLHYLQSKTIFDQPSGRNAFREVQSIGKAFVYELFCKGESAKAMTVLSRLGEDPEAVCRELAFGTVSRFLRSQVIKELAKLNCLDLKDFQILKKISLVEKAYQSSSFWRSYGVRYRLLPEPTTDYGKDPVPVDTELQLICSIKGSMDLKIVCDEIDGVVLGSWNSTTGQLTVETALAEPAGRYWAGAAVWLDAWDEGTFNRVISDHNRGTQGDGTWEACFQKAMASHDWVEMSTLLDLIPESFLQEGELRVRLDCVDKFSLYALPLDSERQFGGRPVKGGFDGPEIDAVELMIPRIKVLSVIVEDVCTGWMFQMMEEKLAQRHIFLRSYWHGTTELISLLARANVLFENPTRMPLHNSMYAEKHHTDYLQPMHELVLHHCVRHSLSNLMALYLDHRSLALDSLSSMLLQAVVGDSQWALWLLFSRIRGREYEASFANARTVLAHNYNPSQLQVAVENDDFILTIDDMAMVGGEMMALCTLMYAPVAVEKCLCTGIVNRHDGPSWQCTLENLRPGLHRFPTLWCSLVAACFSPDTWCFTTSSLSRAGRAKQSFGGYLLWRAQLFSSACSDTSILQMMPHWYPKGVRRLLQLAVQGPSGNGLTESGSNQFLHYSVDDVDPLAWEMTLQKKTEEELYASSKVEDKSAGIEHHLRRGRAMAAFNSFLALRLQNYSPQGSLIREHVGKFQRGGQLHMSSELHAVLSPLTVQEEKYLGSVLPLGIVNYDNPVVVAACASFLELCGVPATMLRVDVAVLSRIAGFFKAEDATVIMSEAQVDQPHTDRSGVVASLARTLADEYAETGVDVLIIKKADASGKRLSAGKLRQVLLNVLQNLEKASLLDWEKQDGSPGSWLWNGIGDGPSLRAQQREASERWSLVTAFCNIHQLPISTTYLAALARDNDWVGFLAEAQLEGCPLEVLVSVASKEFTDSRLQSHILTVLKSSQAAWQKQGSSTQLSSVLSTAHSDGFGRLGGMEHSELFQILAECEHKKHPGTALLKKAKDLRWPLLAIIASCFMDVTPVSCLTVWLEISAARETTLIKVNDAAAHIVSCVGAAVEVTNALSSTSHVVDVRYSRRNPKRRRIITSEKVDRNSLDPSIMSSENDSKSNSQSIPSNLKEASSYSGKFLPDLKQKPSATSSDGPDEQESLSNMIAILCEQQLFFPLLKAFELFMPSSPLLPFIRFLQAFAQMRLSEASAHLTQFSVALKEESHPLNRTRGSTTWITVAAITAADKMLAKCPSAYEQRCLLQLLSAADFGDGGAAAVRFRHLYWKIQVAEPTLQQGRELTFIGMDLEDNDLLSALEKHGKWEEARSWALQLGLSGHHGKMSVHHVTETQAETMVAEWKAFLWDIPSERVALWNHCQALFMRFSFPPLQAGSFFLKHAEANEHEMLPSELHGILLLALQWLSGSFTNTLPVYPLNLLRELETRIWLLAVESEVEVREPGTLNQRPDQDMVSTESQQLSSQKPGQDVTLGVNDGNLQYINCTAKTVSVVDNHLKNLRHRATDFNSNEKETRQSANHDQTSSSVSSGISKFKRRPRNYAQHRRIQQYDKSTARPQAEQDETYPLTVSPRKKVEGITISQEEGKAGEEQMYWEEKVGEQELERAVISLLEVGQISAARQLQQKLAPAHVPIELLLVEAALHLASMPKPMLRGCIDSSMLHPLVMDRVIASGFLNDISSASPVEILEIITNMCREGYGRGICIRIRTVLQVAMFLDMPFTEAFEKQPTQLLQLLSLKAQDSFQEAKLLVGTHYMPTASIAKILAESFVKGVLAAHRGGYMDSSQREEGPAPLLWRSTDFLKWAKLCPSEPELGHALMRLVISGHDLPYVCEVELLILAHHFYMSSACLDGIDVLLALAATRAESYISEGDYISLARLVTGINNFQALHFMLDILIENGQLELLLQKRAGADAVMESSASVRGFRMAVLSTLKHFNPDDLDAFAMVYDQFDMKHEMARLLESRAQKVLEQWLAHYDLEQSEELLETMRYNVEAAEVWSGVDAGNKARWNCAQASLVALQLRMPETSWLCLSETNARRLFVDQSRFQEALVVAEAYKLNQPGEWAPVLWNQMPHPGFDQFLGEYVAALPLPSSMLMELARFYRAEVTARGDQLDFSTWLSPGGMPLEWTRYLAKSFRSLLKHVRDVRLRVQLATLATGFPDVLDVCMRILDKVPETAGPLILRRGHGGTYVPLM